MNCNQAKQLKIEDYLKSINIHPDKSRRSETVFMYKAPYRDETTASFEVNRPKNIWYDHGSGVGGDIIKLIMIMHQTDIKGSLEYLESNNFVPSSFYQQKIPIRKEQERKMEIIKVKTIIDPALINYLMDRRISISLANLYLKEITYKNWNGKIKDYKLYRALGFKNNKGGYELRNKYFKGCTSKDITFIKGRLHEGLNIFEGFFDFLSALELCKNYKINYDVIVLNSIALKGNTIDLIEKYERINLFLDNDPAGYEAVDFYKSNHKKVKNYSKTLYPPPNKDLNEFLIKSFNRNQQ